MHVPDLNDPVGDPGGVRVEVRRLKDVAESVSSVGRSLSDLNQQAVQAWESHAQRMFSILADTVSLVTSGSGAVASDMAAALDRYSNILDVCQNNVRACRQRLQGLVTSTPAGMVPDPVAVNTIVSQANEAYARAGHAARELSAAALNLMGTPTDHGVLPARGDANASFVSQAHRGGFASTHTSAAAFDVQAAQIQSQMTGVMSRLAGSVADASAAPHVVIYPERIDPRPTVMIDPIFTNGQLVFSPAGQSLFVQIEHTPFLETTDGALLAAAYKTGNPALIGLAQDAYETKQESIDNWLEGWREDPGAIQPGRANDVYNPVLDRNDDPYDSV